jgi:hypothetical protein
MHSHDDVIYMQSKFVSNGDHTFVTKTAFRVECGHKSTYPEKRDMKRTPHRAGCRVFWGAECEYTALCRQLSSGQDTLLSLPNTPISCLRKVNSIDVTVMCKQEPWPYCSVLYLHTITVTIQVLAPSRLLLHVSVTRATLSLSHAHVSHTGESVRTAGNWSKLLRTQHNASFSLFAL